MEYDSSTVCNRNEWTIVPYSDSKGNVLYHYVDGTGMGSQLDCPPDSWSSGTTYNSIDYHRIRPIIYLKSSILYMHGTGSESDPFVFKRYGSDDDEAPLCKFTNYPDSLSDTDTSAILQVECTDNKGGLANDLTKEAIAIINDKEKEISSTITLTNTESINNGKRYTFSITFPTKSIDACDYYISFKIKADSIRDNYENYNGEIQQKVKINGECNTDWFS